MQLEAGEGAGRGLWPASPLFLVTASFGLSTANPGLGLGDCPVNPLNSVIVTGVELPGWGGGHWPGSPYLSGVVLRLEPRSLHPLFLLPDHTASLAGFLIHCCFLGDITAI